MYRVSFFFGLSALVSLCLVTQSFAAGCPAGTVQKCNAHGACECLTDSDGDSAPDNHDNCADVFNPSQADFDGNGVGDACEDDPDGDGIGSSHDNCPAVPNQDQGDLDGDGVGDACDDDTDTPPPHHNPHVCPDGSKPWTCGCDLAWQIFENPWILVETIATGEEELDGFIGRLQEQFGFYIQNGNLYETWGTQRGYTGDNDARWIRSRNVKDAQGRDQWFYITAGGELRQWNRDGSGPQDDSTVASLHPQQDECGVCYGTGPSGCDNQCGSTLVEDECGVCGGDGSSCKVAPQCPFYTFEASILPGEGRVGGNRFEDLFQSGSHPLACLENIMLNLYNTSARVKGRRDRRHDDYMALLIGAQADSTYPTYAWAVNNGGLQWVPAEGTGRESSQIVGGRLAHAFHAGLFLLDENCNNITDTAGRDLSAGCEAGSFQWRASPISLLLDEEGFGEDLAFSRFPLEPGDKTGWYEWKASEKAPLVVFDPEHTGVVTSADQLFGHWAFGGKRQASLAGSPAQPSPWRDGYEALGTMDVDGSGEISGAELEPLALWYDRNRDGTSQEGEVVPMQKSDIVALYFEPDLTDGESGDIYANLGYKRKVGDKVTYGASVDWYGNRGESKQELVGRYNQIANICGSGVAKSVEVTEAEEVNIEAAASKSSNPIDGLWQFRIDEGEVGSELPQLGYLTFNTTSGGIKVTGHSYVGVPLKKPVGKAKIAFQMATLEGTQQKSAIGLLDLKFTVSTAEGGRIASTAKLLEGGTLQGVSTTTFTYRGKPKTLSYKWTAVRK